MLCQIIVVVLIFTSLLKLLRPISFEKPKKNIDCSNVRVRQRRFLVLSFKTILQNIEQSEVKLAQLVKWLDFFFHCLLRWFKPRSSPKCFMLFYHLHFYL